MSYSISSSLSEGLEIAIVGMAGRFPGAKNVKEFWRNLRNGIESISFFSDEELLKAGVDAETLKDPRYVKARGILQDEDQFDADFFGIFPREAEIINPQQRFFLECSWEALEDAGYDPGTYQGLIGVFGGVGMDTYSLRYLAAKNGAIKPAEGYQLVISNEKDFLTTRVSYKLNLRGPSLDVQTGCSTSLVAVHIACQNLLNYQCDMALAGGVTIMLPQKQGYFYEEGMITSPDGHCRAFAADAKGTVAGNGVGVVVLKRLADAIADGDHIYAVIKGSAYNNDGSMKVGFTAPSVEGQADVIAAAQAIAETSPETISYIEAHGTGTPLGDPIEITALTKVFRSVTDKNGFCAIGSVKTNVGHLDAAAGIAGLIKTALALQHGQLPPSLHFDQPNPKIDFDNSPFYVNNKLREWKTPAGMPRRAGVSSFGIGGTNAHVILEEAPKVPATPSMRDWQLITISARSDFAVESAITNLVDHFTHHQDVSLPDAAFTLNVGRKAFNHRRIAVCNSLEDAAAVLRNRDPKRLFGASHSDEPINPPVVFTFSGQGSQYINMGRGLYEAEPVFREAVDYCAEYLEKFLGFDLRAVLFPNDEDVEEASRRINQTQITQPALFVLEYALAKLWIEWGVKPQAMIGHSIGEYVAACLAGVFSLDDALKLVAVRGSLMQSMPSGAMLSVPMEEGRLRPLLNGRFSLAAVNNPSLCVVAGKHEDMQELEQQLLQQGIETRLLHTSHAFHSEMMDPIIRPFVKEVEKVVMSSPQIPYISNVTGSWIREEDVMDPGYWGRHLRNTVRFSDGIAELLKIPDSILLEVGPGNTLTTLVKRHPGHTASRVVLSSVRHVQEKQADEAFILNTLGKLWLVGVQVNWAGFYRHEQRKRVPLPTYPFERQRYWLETKGFALGETLGKPSLSKNSNLNEWFYLPTWKRSDLTSALEKLDWETVAQNWLLFIDDDDIGIRLAAMLAGHERKVTTVAVADHFQKISDFGYVINPADPRDYESLIASLKEDGELPGAIVHLWGVDANGKAEEDWPSFEVTQERGYRSLVYLAQSLGKQNVVNPLQIAVVTTNLQDVTGDENLRPEKATVLGPCQVIPQEYQNIVCRSIDVGKFDLQPRRKNRLIERLVLELASAQSDLIVAYRGNHRWIQSMEKLPGTKYPDDAALLRHGGVYLITGGLGRIGLTFAEYLAEKRQAKIILLDQIDFPPREQWEGLLNGSATLAATRARIQRLLAMESQGAAVMVLSVDIANEQQMRQAVAAATRRFGKINGVFHAAGLVGAQAIRPIQESGPDDWEMQFKAKICGLQTLAKICEAQNPDFILLQSSLAAVLGGLGLAAYSAANCYLDAFARKQNLAGDPPYISVNWDAWKFDEEERNNNIGKKLMDFAVTPQEGINVLQRILSMPPMAQVIISTGDLQQRMARWLKHEAKAGRDEAPVSAPAHARPNLQTTFVPPSSDLEKELTAKWQELLGIQSIGIYDDFFDLGGNSLLGTQLLSQLRDMYRMELPIRTLFEDPTVAGVAKYIESYKEKGQDHRDMDKIAETIAQVQNLSEEEVRALLMQESH